MWSANVKNNQSRDRKTATPLRNLTIAIPIFSPSEEPIRIVPLFRLIEIQTDEPTLFVRVVPNWDDGGRATKTANFFRQHFGEINSELTIPSY
jgi:hypothetical protein